MTSDAVRLSAQAREDLGALIDHLLERDAEAARRMTEMLDHAFRTLASDDPRVDGREVVLRSGGTCRRWYVHPVVILYEREAGAVVVLALHHHAREPIAR